MNSSLLQLQSSLFSSLPEDTFTQKPWRVLKNNLATLRSTSQQNILLSECQKFLNLLKDLNICSSLEEYFGDSSIKKFFLSKLIPANIKSFLRCNDIVSPQIEEIFNECLRHVILLWVKTLPEDDLALRKTVEHILNPKLPYYHRKSSYKPSQAKNQNNGVNEDNVVDSAKPVISTLFAEFIESLKQEKRLTSHIYEIISNQESLTSSMRMMTLACFIANHFNFIFPKDAMIESMSQIKQIIWDTLFLRGEPYIEDLTENNIIDVLKAYSLLLRKLSYSQQDKHREIDLLRLQVSMIHLKSLIRDNKLIGLRLVNTVIGELENPSSTQLKLKSQPACNEALRDIFREVYRCKFLWKQNIGQSLKLFEYMIRHKLLSSSDSKALKVALNLLGQNQKPEIVDFLKKAKENDQLDLFVNCLISENLSNLQALQIQDIFVLYRIYKVSSRVYGKVIKFLREILAKSDTIANLKVVEFAFFRHKKMMFSNGSGTHVFTAFTDSVDEIQKDVTKFSCFRIIQLFILDIMRRFVIDERRGISEILHEKGVLKLFVNHIKSFKESLQQKSLSSKKEELPYITQISMRIDCLKQLFKYGTTFTLLNELWESLVNQAFIPAERKLFFKMLSEVTEEMPSMNSKFGQRLFQEKIITKETQDYLQASKEGALYFKAFFVALNQSLDRIEAPRSSNFSLKVPPEELKGYNELWEFIMSSKDPESTQEIINFLMKIYSACKDQSEADPLSIREKELARCFKYLKEALSKEKTQSFENESKDRCIKCLRMINAMMDGSETGGIENMNTHSKLLKGEQLQIHVDLHGYFGYKRGQVDLTIDSNSTVFELLRETAKRFGVGWDEILLSKSKNPQDQNKILNQYGRTLSELGIKTHENLKALTQEIPKINLLTPENTLHPRVSKAFCDIFEQFSENDKMSPENLASFINACTGDCPNTNHDERTRATFSSYDTDRDGYMTKDDFLRFYCQAAMKKPHIVWDNLNKFKKMRNDLKDVEEVNNEKVDKQNLISSLISSNSTQFDLLFSLLDQEESIALEVWTLLNRLPTNPKIFEDIVLMKAVRGIADPENRDWNAILNMNSKYQLLYALNVVEYLFHFSQDGVNTILLSDNTDVLESRKIWKTDFINSGGLDHLCGIFSVFKPSESTVLIAPYKRVLTFVNAINSKLKLADSVSLEQEQDRKREIMRFMELSARYQDDYITMEQVVAANFMIKSIKNLKNRRKV